MPRPTHQIREANPGWRTPQRPARSHIDILRIVRNKVCLLCDTPTADAVRLWQIAPELVWEDPMTAIRLCCTLVVSLLMTACTPPPELPPVPTYDTAALAAVRYKVVLVAGDSRLPAFDNAVEAVSQRLGERGRIVPGGTQRLSAAPALTTQNGIRVTSLGHVLDAVENMRPQAGEGCFVFATSHGAVSRGLSLAATQEFLDPYALDRALARGCGNAPTAIVISGCFSGIFAQAPMTRPNRIVLTAARADRSSFGCKADRTYTVYDKCLLDALDTGGNWRQVYMSLQICVGVEENRQHFTPSMPQAWFGPAVADMPLPLRM